MAKRSMGNYKQRKRPHSAKGQQDQNVYADIPTINKETLAELISIYDYGKSVGEQMRKNGQKIAMLTQNNPDQAGKIKNPVTLYREFRKSTEELFTKYSHTARELLFINYLNMAIDSGVGGPCHYSSEIDQIATNIRRLLAYNGEAVPRERVSFNREYWKRW